MTDPVQFYDGLAADYHLVYGDGWDGAVRGQGEVLARMIMRLAPRARRVLDCSCGIGTQAIGLALAGYAVSGSDPSGPSLRRARAEAARFGVEIPFTVADFRDLAGVGGPFEVVVSADNAVPHMPTPADVETALRGMRGALAPGGLLLVSTRDYDAALAERAPRARVVTASGPPRRLLVQTHAWGADREHVVRFLILAGEEDGGWTVRGEHHVRYRALPAAELADAATAAGFAEVVWHPPGETGYHQPVLSARAR